jgi:DNA (cytosine-5)-methyltransferase 1
LDILLSKSYICRGDMNELALFAGAGGGILGGHLLGWRTICAVEWEPYAACVLAARQNDGILPPFPIWDDVQTFDGKPWAGRVDIVSGGFPCQDISVAGKGAGIDGARSGMWSHMARIVGEVRPRYVYVENSPMLTSRGLHRVLGDLAKMGFDARWGVVSASDVGAPHQRDRIWILAHSTQLQCNGGDDNTRVSLGRESVSEFGNGGGSQIVADSDSTQREGNKRTKRSVKERTFIGKSSWWDSEPNVGRVAHGVAARVDRLKAIGNGQVPLVAATAFRLLGG